MGPSKLDNTSKSVNALLNLLTAAGLDTVDNSLIEREKDRCHLDIRTDLLPDEPQAWDRQVEKLIRQLKESVRDTPERDVMADMVPQHQQEHDEPPQQQPQYEAEQQVPEADDRRQYLEREFSSTSYPKIGPGYSDSISVVSDLTIPTVVNGMTPDDEEKYEGPPMSIGFERKSSSSNKQLRRPSLEKNEKNRREAAQQLRPPSRRIVTRPGGAAASRRQNHQMTMAQLQSSSNSPPPGSSGKRQARNPTSATMTVNDFPSLKEVSTSGSGGGKDEFGSRRSSGSRGERRSLLGKSNKYAASVSATASQRMLLARQQSAKKTSTSRRRRPAATSADGDPASSPKAKKDGDGDGFGFSSLDAADDAASKKSGDPVLIDEDGFIIGGEQQPDPFAVAPTPSFPTSFSKDSTFSKSFLPAPTKDTKKKKGSGRRASLTGPPKKEDRINAVEQATKKKLDILRRAAEGDAAFGNRVDMVEQETMKQIRRIREHYK